MSLQRGVGVRWIGTGPMSEDHKNLALALLAFQAEAPKLHKTRDNDFFKSKYLPLEDLLDKVLPVLQKHGLLWFTRPMTLANPDGTREASLDYCLEHAETGEKIYGSMPLLMKDRTPQALGSSITYARRYSMMAVLGLAADKDDDGNEGSGKGKRQPPADIPLNGDRSRLMSAAERARMVKAIEDTGEAAAFVFSCMGWKDGQDLTLQDGQKVKEFLAKIKTEGVRTVMTL